MLPTTGVGSNPRPLGVSEPATLAPALTGNLEPLNSNLDPPCGGHVRGGRTFKFSTGGSLAKQPRFFIGAEHFCEDMFQHISQMLRSHFDFLPVFGGVPKTAGVM